jgi:hypothetical protein
MPEHYLVFVGVVPVRTVDELANVLIKGRLTQPTCELDVVYSMDYVGTEGEETALLSELQEIQQSNPGLKILPFKAAFGKSCQDVYEAVFHTGGALATKAHGLLDQVALAGCGFGGITVAQLDEFTKIKPVWFMPSCYVSNYSMGPSLAESALRAAMGPAVVVGPPDLVAKKFMTPILIRRTIGEWAHRAVEGYGEVPGSLFGDPTLVVLAPGAGE